MPPGAPGLAIFETWETGPVSPMLGPSNALQLPNRALVYHVPGVERSSRLEQQKPALLVGDRFVLHASRNHNELPLFNPHMPVAKLHPKPALHHQKHLVFVFVMMKHKLTFDLV